MRERGIVLVLIGTWIVAVGLPVVASVNLPHRFAPGTLGGHASVGNQDRAQRSNGFHFMPPYFFASRAACFSTAGPSRSPKRLMAFCPSDSKAGVKNGCGSVPG